jgi:hypothetical protein
MRNKLTRIGGIITVTTWLALSALPAGAAGVAGAVTQSYGAGSGVLPGMVVEMKGQGTVVPLASKDLKSMLGVVVPLNDSPIVLSPTATSPSQQVLVATSGRYNLLVSNQNGSIQPNDYLSISAISGVAMKAEASQEEVVGRAAAAFDGSHGLGSLTLKGSLGRSTTVTIGSVTADVRLAPNPMHQVNNQVPGFLNKIASGVANKTVSPVRIYLSVAIVLTVLFVTGSMFYGGIRSGISAIGRNPLAKKSIGRGLLQTVVAALIIFLAGIFAAYIILL